MHPRIAFGQVGAYVQLIIHYVSQLSLKKRETLGTGSHSVSSCITFTLGDSEAGCTSWTPAKKETPINCKAYKPSHPRKICELLVFQSLLLLLQWLLGKASGFSSEGKREDVGHSERGEEFIGILFQNVSAAGSYGVRKQQHVHKNLNFITEC